MPAACGPTAGAVSTSLASSPVTDPLVTFDSAWSIIGRTHWDTTYNGVNWSAVRAELRPKAAAATTTVKTRLLAGHSQIARFDQEAFLNDDPARMAVMSKISDLMPQADVAVISDYAKGVCDTAVCRAVIEGAARAGIPTIVDPFTVAWIIAGAVAIAVAASVLPALRAARLAERIVPPPGDALPTGSAH
jgi:hypothetical protein